MNKKIIIGAVAAIILIGGGLWLSGRNQKKEDEVSPEITLEPNRQIVTELTPPMSEQEKQEIEDAFAKEGVEMTLIKDVSGGQAVGTAWRQYDGTKFYYKAEANGLPDPDKGFYYESWLVGPEGFFSTGRVAVVNRQGSIYYQAQEDKTAFRGVVITLEQEDGNPAPDKHILEGSF